LFVSITKLCSNSHILFRVTALHLRNEIAPGYVLPMECKSMPINNESYT